jgi:branched-chain amino acid aminotransferase
MHSWVNFNGNFIKEGFPLVTANNRGFRYGDGIFETIRYANGRMMHRDLHLERLRHGAATIKLELPDFAGSPSPEEEIARTVEKNRLTGAARVRLMLFRGDGGLYELDGPGGGYIIQVWPLDEQKQQFAETGLVLGIYQGGVKACDELANLKSNNYLLYAMAAIHAKQNRCSDSLVLNTHGRVCDASIANVFWVKNGRVFTPPLSEGCVAGVMRKHLLQSPYGIEERPCSVEDIENADEVFLTNAIAGIRWVQSFKEKIFKNSVARSLYQSTMHSESC